MSEIRRCLLEDDKICDDCGECDRCDLDPNKICDNCCKCIAMEDEGSEFRSRIVNKDGIVSDAPISKPLRRAPKKVQPKSSSVSHDETEDNEPSDEPTELTPELVAYWERILIEHGEAPADDGFGEIEVDTRVPVYGKRRVSESRRHR